jgi:hypothetical protein
MSTTIVAVKPKKCKPFVLEVMVLIPESGFKFEVVVEKTCTPDKDSLWKLVFDLYQKLEGNWEQLIHVSFKPQTDEQTKGVQSMAIDGITAGSAEILTKEVFPVAKEVAIGTTTEANKTALTAGLSKAAVKQLDL